MNRPLIYAASALALSFAAHGISAEKSVVSAGLSRGGVAIVEMDVGSGNFMRRVGNSDVMAAPGSVLKPFVLMTAMQSGAVREHETIACRGSLLIAGHNLACSHPRDVTVLDARQALSESCNNYFAIAAQRMPSRTLVSGFRSFGLTPTREPRDADERVLLALGLDDVLVSPMQLAQAYRRLAGVLNGAPDTSATKTLRDGLLQSVQTGMANAARAQGVALGGKTGTVDEPGGRSHGWFAGIAFRGLDARVADRIVVVFVPNGNGADAAALAGRIVGREAWRL